MACVLNQIRFVQGDATKFKLYLKDECNPSVDIDLTGATVFSVALPGTTSPVIKTLGSGVVILSATQGVVEVTLSSSDTNLVLVGNKQTIEINYQLPGGVDKYKSLPNVLYVTARVLFP